MKRILSAIALLGFMFGAASAWADCNGCDKKNQDPQSVVQRD